MVCARCLERVDDLLDVQLHVLGELVHAGRTPGPRGESLLRILNLERELLGAARHVRGPARIAEVALELTDDRWNRERGERVPAGWIEAIDRLDQPEAGDLEQVVEGLARAAVAPRQLARER